MHKVIICIVFILISNCADDRLNLNYENKIVGGNKPSLNTPASYATVALNVNCSGVVVADNLVLTAAHCIAGFDRPELAFFKLKVLFSENYKDASITTERLATQIGYGPDRMSDIAWIKFDGGLPAGYAPVPILSLNKLKNLPNSYPITLAGFGTHGYGIESDGSKLEVITKFNRFFSEGEHAGLFLTGLTPGKNGCNEDSGGPAFVFLDGTWFVAGIINGPDDIINVVETCDDGSARMATIDFHRQWIEQTSGLRFELRE